MVDSIDIYKSLNARIGTVMRNPEMLKHFLKNFKNLKNPYS